ncbi:hypothetical protein L5515_015460 [Caenorhabditis briggsae]|uniref:Uncharacterized protein n=1 Tax=Caenorhabditis briggsae TaxID=6238 RepID=A0AAE9JA09_CAEBR|nr:hypothetical protein L5515_015460 [Caenorhabditis briggsae]
MHHHHHRGHFSAAIHWAHHQEQQQQLQIQHEGHWSQLHQQLQQGLVGHHVPQHHHHQGDVDAYVVRLADDVQRYKGLFEEASVRNGELKATVNLNRLELDAKDRVIAEKDQAAGGPRSGSPPGSPMLPAFLYEPSTPRGALRAAPPAPQAAVPRAEDAAAVAHQDVVPQKRRIKREVADQEEKEVVLTRHREPTRDMNDAFERTVQQWMQWEHREEEIEDVGESGRLSLQSRGAQLHPPAKEEGGEEYGLVQNNAQNSQAQFPYESGRSVAKCHTTREKGLERTVRQSETAPEGANPKGVDFCTKRA